MIAQVRSRVDLARGFLIAGLFGEVTRDEINSLKSRPKNLFPLMRVISSGQGQRQNH